MHDVAVLAAIGTLAILGAGVGIIAAIEFFADLLGKGE